MSRQKICSLAVFKLYLTNTLSPGPSISTISINTPANNKTHPLITVPAHWSNYSHYLNGLMFQMLTECPTAAKVSLGWMCWHQQSLSLVFSCIFCQFGWEDLDSWKWASPSFSVSFFVSIFHLWSPTPRNQVQLQFLPLWSLQGGQADLPPLLRWVHLPQAELPACILQPSPSFW